MEPQKPTLGRQVRFAYNGQEMTATICFVHSDNVVNLSVIDHNGKQFAFTSATKRELPTDEEREKDIGHGTWWWPQFNR